VALKGGIMDGLDALFSMVSIPKGLGLAATGVGKSAFINAIILALEIISLSDKKYNTVLRSVKNRFK
jgi:5-(carboxyamino)imidazole ribonucleotide mutase